MSVGKIQHYLRLLISSFIFYFYSQLSEYVNYNHKTIKLIVILLEIIDSFRPFINASSSLIVMLFSFIVLLSAWPFLFSILSINSSVKHRLSEHKLGKVSQESVMAWQTICRQRNEAVCEEHETLTRQVDK